MCGLKAQLSTEWISKHCMNWCGKIKSFYWLVFRYWANKLDRHWQLCGISSPGLKCRTMLLVKSVVQQFFFVFVINKYLEFTFLFLKLLYCRKKKYMHGITWWCRRANLNVIQWNDGLQTSQLLVRYKTRNNEIFILSVCFAFLKKYWSTDSVTKH